MHLLSGVSKNNPGITELRINGTRSKKEWGKLAEAMKANSSVRMISLGATNVASIKRGRFFGALMNVFQNNPVLRLEKLYLDSDDLTNQHIRLLSSWLAHSHTLHTLSLARNNLTDQEISIFTQELMGESAKKISILSWVTFEGNRIGK